MNHFAKFHDYWDLTQLTQWKKTLALLWPALWGLWIAGVGQPSFYLVIVFVIGSFATLALGHTLKAAIRQQRKRSPKTSRLSLLEHWEVVGLLLLIAAFCVLSTNWLVVALSFVGLGFIILITLAPNNLSDLFLILAWGWSIPLAFAATQTALPVLLWLMYAAVICWRLLLFLLKHKPRQTLLIACLQLLQMMLFAMIGAFFGQSIAFFIVLLIIALLSIYQQKLLHQKGMPFDARIIRLQQWYGSLLLLGTLLSY
jgi:4-hydroxybenzoate polyprenyltransferase